MSRSTAAEAPTLGRRKTTWAELVDRTRVPTYGWCIAGIVVSAVVFYSTTLRPPGLLVWVNYAAGFVGAVLIGHFVSQLIPLGDRGRLVLAIVLGATAVGVWAQFDQYLDRWTNEGGDGYADWTYRWSGKISHRTLKLKNHSKSAMMGPMSGDPEKPHGRWREYSSRPNQQPADAWFWYGRRISQGEWELHNRR